MKKLFLFILFTSTQAFALPAVQTLLKEMDKQQEQTTDLTARVSFLQSFPDQADRKFEMIYYRRDSDDSFMLQMLAPNREAGNGYLKVGDNFWMYRKNTRTFQHINRDENLSGTDVKGGDLEMRKWVELYAAKKENDKELIEETTFKELAVYVFEVEAIVDDVTYPALKITVRKDNFLPIRVDSYSASGQHMLTQFYAKWDKDPKSGRYIPAVMYSFDQFEKGKKTVTTISGVSYENIPDKVFTKAYLENQSR